MARTIAEGISIDTTTGTEDTEWVKPKTFPGSIALFASDKEKGAKEARKHSGGPDEMSFWRDSSILDSKCTGASVA